MKTIIEFTDGHNEEYVDIAPCYGEGFDNDEHVISLVDEQMTNIGDDIPVTKIKRIVFEP